MLSKLLLPLAVGTVFTCAASLFASPERMTKTGHSASSKAGRENNITETQYPSQTSVAAKKPFLSAPASAAKGALDAKDLAGAQKLVGKPGTMQGTVSAVFVPRGNSIVILNFSPEYRDAVSAVVEPNHYAQFPDLQTLRGKHVLMHGMMKDYKGRPELELTDPAQVKLLP